MIEVGESTEASVIASWLQAEIASSRWRNALEEILTRLRVGRDIIDAPDLGDAEGNTIRARIFQLHRGYPDRLAFFGFPKVTWHSIGLEPEDFSRLRYANEPRWLVPLSGPSRRVEDAARNFTARTAAADSMRQIHGIVTAIRSGACLPPLIVAQDVDGSMIVLEGNLRATAYVITGKITDQAAYVARAPSFASWRFYWRERIEVQFRQQRIVGGPGQPGDAQIDVTNNRMLVGHIRKRSDGTFYYCRTDSGVVYENLDLESVKQQVRARP